MSRTAEGIKRGKLVSIPHIFMPHKCRFQWENQLFLWDILKFYHVWLPEEKRKLALGLWQWSYRWICDKLSLSRFLRNALYTRYRSVPHIVFMLGTYLPTCPFWKCANPQVGMLCDGWHKQAFSCIWPDFRSRRHPNSCPDEASNPEMACAFQKHMWVKHGETPWFSLPRFSIF